MPEKKENKKLMSAPDMTGETGDGECSGFLMYYPCPVCGLPIAEGFCKAGHAWEVRTAKITEMCDVFDSLNLPLTHIEIIDGSEPYEDREDKWVRLLLTNIYEAEKPQKEKEIFVSVYVDYQYANTYYVKSAIEDILAEYLYRPQCKNPLRVYERWFPKDHRIRKNYSLRLSQPVAEKLKEAAKYYGVAPGKLIEAYARMWWADEVEGVEWPKPNEKK